MLRPAIAPSVRYRFRFYWLVIVLSHLYCAAYLLGFAALHFVLNRQEYFKRQLATQMNLVFVAVVYVISSVLHVRRLVVILHSSFRYRMFRFEYVRAKLWRPRRRSSALASRLHVWTVSGVTYFRKKYLARGGVFGIFGEHGDIRIWCVECLNLGAHMFQANRWSRLVRPTTTVAIAVLLAWECLYPALYHTFSDRKPNRTRRAQLLLVDIVIDTLLCALIPVWLVAPFIVQYLADPHVVNSNYSETWYIEGVLTFKQSLATTPLDLITKLSPFYLNYLSLVEISSGAHVANILTTRSDRTATREPSLGTASDHHSVGITARVHPESPAVLQPGVESLSGVKSKRSCISGCLLSKRVWFWTMRFLFISSTVYFVMMALVGTGILGPGPVKCRDDCLYNSIPWFTNSCVCIVQELNCVKLNISGSDGVDKALTEYPKKGNTAVLILNDCRGLVIPRSIKNLPALMGIYIYSSELVAWGEDAALTSNAFALISYVVFVNTTLSTGIPAGLLTNLASTVQDIEIISSFAGNAKALVLPMNLHEKWPHIGTFYMERCNLTELPEPLLQMANLRQLSLAGNAITELPESLFASPLFNSLGYLLLSANPGLTHLPPNMESASSLLELYVDAASVDELDLARVPASSVLKVSAAESPVCASASTTQSPISSRVSCSGLYGGMYTLGVYPLLPEQRATRSAKFLPLDL